MSARMLSDDELLSRVEALAARAREATADLLEHLIELEARGLHLKNGYGSLFQYCRDGLGLAEYSAYNRIEAARAARKFPLILDMLRAGEIHLASVRTLAPHLTPENHAAALASARGKSKMQVEEIAVRIAPRPDVPEFVRRLPERRPPLVSAPPATLPVPMAPRPAPPPLLPLSPGRHRLQATIDGETVQVLEMAQDLLRHAVPSGDIAQVVDRALRCLVEKLLKEKFAATAAPRAATAVAAHSRHIPAEVKRAVFLRDRGRCAYMSQAGKRCGVRGFIEFHHVKPYMAGGEATVENIQLRCRAHNQYEGRTYFRREEAAQPP